jgi:hypothetical protein
MCRDKLQAGAKVADVGWFRRAAETPFNLVYEVRP